MQLELLKRMSGFVWGWFLHVGCIFVPIVFLHFTLHLTKQRKKLSWCLWLAYLAGITFILLNTFTDIFTGKTIYRDDYAYPKPEALYPLYITFFQLIGAGTLALLIQWGRALSGSAKPVFYLFLLVHVLAYIGSMDNYLIMYDLRIFLLYPYGLYLIIPYVLFGSYAIHKLQMMTQA